MCDFIVDSMRKGDLNILKQIVKSMDNINDVVLQDEDNSLNLLHLAAGISCDYRDAILELLLKLGADANYPGREDRVEGVRALHIAASWGYDMSVKMLLLHHADASLRDSSGYSPIDYASVYDNYTCISILLKYGSLNTSSDTSDWSHIFETSAGDSSTASFSFSPFNHSVFTPSRTPSSKPKLTETLIEEVSKINLAADTTCDYYTAAEDTISPLDKSFIGSNSDESQSLSSSQGTQESSRKESSHNSSLCFTDDSPPPKCRLVQAVSCQNRLVDGDHTDDDVKSIANEQTTNLSFTLDLTSGSTSQDDTRETAVEIVITPDKSVERSKESISDPGSQDANPSSQENYHDADNGLVSSQEPTCEDSSYLKQTQEPQDNYSENTSSPHSQEESDGVNKIKHGPRILEVHDEKGIHSSSQESNTSERTSRSRQSGEGASHSDTDKSIIGLDLDRYVTRESLDSNLEKLGKDYATILRVELRKAGQNPGPITDSTKRIYMKLLLSLQRTMNLDSQAYIRTPNQKLGGYSSELRSLLMDRFPYGEALDLEKEFINASETDAFGGPKQFFNYLLLDPRISDNLCEQNLPRLGEIPSSPLKGGLTKLQIDKKLNGILFTKFIKAVFYIGKGQKKRDLAHLYDAIADRDSITKAKIDHIRDIWSDGFGVISLHVFNNITSQEALTREAIMIDAIGLDNLTNIMKGTVKIRMSWNDHKRKLLGTLLLWKAFSILLHEGERQIRRDDLNKRIGK